MNMHSYVHAASASATEIFFMKVATVEADFECTVIVYLAVGVGTQGTTPFTCVAPGVRSKSQQSWILVAVSYLQQNTNAHAHAHAHTRAHTQIHTRTRAHAHTRINAHTEAHI